MLIYGLIFWGPQPFDSVHRYLFLRDKHSCMSLNEKFGRGGSSLHKVSVNTAPDVVLLRRLLNDLSDATTASQCEISWQVADDFYSLTLDHSRLSARAEWKLYHIQGGQSNLLWSHATNDLHAVHRLLAGAHQQAKPGAKSQTGLVSQQAKPGKSQTGLTALPAEETVSQERRAININSNLSGKLRKLFIGAQEEIITGSQLLPVGKSQPLSKKQGPSKPATEFIDIIPGREVLQNLFMGEFGIFSYPTFLFFLEREYFQALDNKTPSTLIVFKATSAVDNIDVSAFPSPLLQEIAKRIKYTQRKTDIFAQYEEGKFVVLLPETGSAGAKSFVRRVEKALSKTPLGPGLSDDSIKFTFGIATLGEHCKTLHEFMTYADKALERALELGKDIFSDEDVLEEQSFDENKIKSVDLTAARQLVAQLISVGIFTYPAFLAFLEQEYYRAVRKEQDLLIIILKVRLYEETFDEAANLLPTQAFYEVIRRIGCQLNKRDIFAHYGHGNFVIMRSNATVSQMDAFGKKLIQNIISEEWLTPECPTSSLVTHTQICIARAHPTAANLFCFVPTS